MPDQVSPVTGAVFLDDPGYPKYQYGPENGQAGLRLPTVGYGTCAVAAVTGPPRTNFLRGVPSRRMRVNRIRFRTMVAAGGDDPVEVAVYNSLGVRMSTSGAVAGVLNSAAGIKDVNLLAAVTLEAGSTYYFSISQSALIGTAAQFITHSLGTVECWQLFGATVGVCDGMSTTDGAGAAPATMAAAVPSATAALTKLIAMEG